ncbi:hypothetical protein MNBD_BACTEROID05-841 [hydrothermal vent metagenome]|uniref:PilZ domain-containing protein n=1 Tax=hydrothermal vent metagenome TaxID=652676 RepID=A0A3B0T2V4_9ZZZZ
MIKVPSQDDRRQDRRVEKVVPLKIKLDDGSLLTETGNISRSGAYCQVTQSIEPMTKLKINIALPFKSGSKTTNKKISCEGVIVRVDPDEKNQLFNIAIFFNDISRKDADTIVEFISLD